MLLAVVNLKRNSSLPYYLWAVQTPPKSAPLDLDLRALEPTDDVLLYKWENDRSHWPEGSTVQPWSREVLARYTAGVQDIYTDRQLRLVITAAGTPIGLLDFYEFEPRHRRSGIGLLIADPQMRGKGLGKSALQLGMNYGFDILGLRLLFAQIAETNPVSLSLFEGCGFAREGSFPHWLELASGKTTVHHLQCLSHEA